MLRHFGVLSWGSEHGFGYHSIVGAVENDLWPCPPTGGFACAMRQPSACVNSTTRRAVPLLAELLRYPETAGNRSHLGSCAARAGLQTDPPETHRSGDP